MKTKRDLAEISRTIRAMSETLIDMVGVMRCLSDHLEDKKCEHEQTTKTVKAKDAKNGPRVAKDKTADSKPRRKRGRPVVKKTV